MRQPVNVTGSVRNLRALSRNIIKVRNLRSVLSGSRYTSADYKSKSLCLIEVSVS
ncbi:hypothetical protein DJ62_2388 [Yersinia enterocolitica]|nr:hypothetical protein DJ62_2388 [Yersinia enterocolitica]KGA74827.1 hypothetical protein DJ61_3860 [Yersinia enterocolitica]